MYRLISARNAYHSSFHNKSLVFNVPIKSGSLTDVKCSFCRKYLLGRHNTENLLAMRHQSTSTVSVLRSLKKKTKHKNYKKYGELLEGNKEMTETKVSISKLRAVDLSKLASSPVSLGQLHQLTTKISTKNVEVDPELLQSVKEKILKKPNVDTIKTLEEDKCALVYTTHQLSNLEDIIKTKQYIEMVKESYYNFRKATLYEQRLQDLQCAINEGVSQEFDLDMKANVEANLDQAFDLPRSPHAVFKQLFVDNEIDSYDQELMHHISNLQTQGIAHPAIEDLYDEGTLHADIGDVKEDLSQIPANVKSLNIKKAKELIKKRKKESREKRRAIQELSMKQDLKEMSQKGKQEALHRLLASHLHLLCSLNMIHEGRQVLQYYRQRSLKMGHMKIDDIKVYNALLHGYAKMGLIEDIKSLLKIMTEDHVELNVQSYAAIFECIERSNIIDKESLLKHFTNMMNEKGIVLNDLLDKTKFLYDQREVVLKAIRRLDDNFTPQYTPPNIDYDCPIMNQLKLNKIENKNGLNQSPAGGLLSLEHILEKGNEQLDIEIEGEIKVNNIDVKNVKSQSVEFCGRKLKKTEDEWRSMIKEAFIRNVGTLKSQCTASHCAITLYPYLNVLEGLIENIKSLLKIMTEDHVEPNVQSYAAIFECIERSNIIDKESLLKHFTNMMNEKGIVLNDLLDITKFLYDQREVVLKAIRRLDDNFTPQYTPPNMDYDCPIMNQLKLNKIENKNGLNQSPAGGLLSLEHILEKGNEQLDIEIEGEIKVNNIDVKNVKSQSVEFCRRKLKETEDEWRSVIKEAFIRNVGTLKSQCTASHCAITLYPYLNVLEVNQFVELIMGEISKLVDGSESYSPTLKLLQRDLGTQVYQKYQIEQFRRNGVLDKIKRVYAQYCEWYVNRQSVDGTGLPYNGRQVWQALLHKNRDGASLDIEEEPWPLEIKQNVGKFLYNIIINDVKIDVNMFKTKAKEKKLPAVYKVHRSWGHMVRLELKPHPVLARVWAGAERPHLRMRASLTPTRGPPAPWVTVNSGAYLVTPTPLIRMPIYINSQHKKLKEAPPAALYPVLDSLNQLGEVPWVINQPILDLQLKLFRSGGSKKLDIAPPSSALDTSQFALGSDAASTFKRRVAINRARAEMHSLWCDALYKLSLADHFRNTIFWLPHNMDFRGRVYACPPHVSVLGADAQRALLMFAKKEPLGPRGLRWLKLHAINLTGNHKKDTVEERLAYADSIMDLILDSADRPLNGKGWWMESEEPWQTLACCIEIANAIRSPNPEEYMCGFPVHQDGSCNGLQHYAALGGDSAGARAVNLAPLDRPQDVYSAVAALVEEMRKRDAAAGVKQAQILENFVRRKVIKQTVMTTVYGVTRFGARLQIAKQLKDIDDFPKEHVWACSQYLTTKTFDSLQEMFTSTKQIQDWFTDCAKLISGVCGESVEWVTPLGLPVVQPYYRRMASSSAQYRAAIDQNQRPCTMKQRNAFPPNFIHSLDSTHMMLTGLHCAAAGITFVSVHDCFWTHPNTVDVMNRICREQFVSLHSQPILEDLSDFLVKRYGYDQSELSETTTMSANKKRVNNVLRRVPGKGDFDIKSVLRSVYFFS